MCRRCQAQAAQDRAAEALERVCSARVPVELLRDASTLQKLPKQPRELGELLDRLFEVPATRRTRSAH